MKFNISWYLLYCFFPDIFTIDKFFRTLKSSTRDISSTASKTDGVMFYQDNAPAHKSVVAVAAVRDCGVELVDHSPYSPALVPSGYFLFPNVKNCLAGKQYRTVDEVISVGEFFFFFEDQNESFYTTGIQVLQHQWKKCVDRRGDYVEK